MIHKKIILLLCIAVFSVCMQTGWAQDMTWASEAVEYCREKGIISGMEDGDLALDHNLTREQMAKMLVDAFDKMPADKPAETVYSDVETWRWSINYIAAFQNYRKKKDAMFRPLEKVTREEFAASIVLISGLT